MGSKSYKSLMPSPTGRPYDSTNRHEMVFIPVEHPELSAYVALSH